MGRCETSLSVFLKQKYLKTIFVNTMSIRVNARGYFLFNKNTASLMPAKIIKNIYEGYIWC